MREINTAQCMCVAGGGFLREGIIVNLFWEGGDWLAHQAVNYAKNGVPYTGGHDAMGNPTGGSAGGAAGGAGWYDDGVSCRSA